MASACVTNVGISPENFLDCTPVNIPSYGWLSPRISFSHELQGDDASKDAVSTLSPRNQKQSENAGEEKPEKSDLEIYGKDFEDFEFRLEDPVTMLPADELFSDGKMVPLQLSNIRQSMILAPASSGCRLTDTPNICRRTDISGTDPYLFSPKAPTCSIHWRQLLRLKKLYQKSNGKPDDNKMGSSSLSSDGSIDCGNNTNKNAARSLKYFLPRNSKSSLNASIDDSSVSIPFLKDSENVSESVSIAASRLSLSSSSSGHEHDDIPRLSLDSDKTSTVNRTANQTTTNLPRLRVDKLKQKVSLSAEKQAATARGGLGPIRRAPEVSDPVHVVSADSPRMNPSGKIVFQSLERSSSSPSTFNGRPRYKHQGVERSYSAKVRITPVLNVPVCSLRRSSRSGVFGIPLFSSQQKKEPPVSGSVGGSRSQQSHGKNCTDVRA